MDAEDLFIRLYEDFTPTAEYLQADAAHRNFLPETMIVAGLSAALGAFAKDFFGTLGKSVAEAIATRIKAAFHSSAARGDRSAMLEGLELMSPFLAQLRDMTDAQRGLYRDVVAATLGTRGYPDDVARETAAALIASLTAAGGGAPA